MSKNYKKAAFLFLLANPFWFPFSAQAQTSLHPAAVNAATGGMTFIWDRIDAASFVAVLSSADSFSPVISSATLPAGTSVQAYSALSPNTTYYFEAKISTEPDDAYLLNRAAASTLAQSPAAINITFPNETSMRANWNVNGNPYWTNYRVQASTAPDFSVINFSMINSYNGSLLVSGLLQNTTYYVRAQAVNNAGAETSFSAFTPTSTLARHITVTFTDVGSTTFKAGWQAYLPSPPAAPSDSCSGYVLDVSTSRFFTGLVFTSATADIAFSTLSVTGLWADTTYYYRTGVFNPVQAVNYSATAVFVTTTSAPSGFQLLEVDLSSASLRWDAFPPAPSSATAQGYRVEASSTGFGGGNVISWTTYDISRSSVYLNGLLPNTTWFFRAGALNLAGVAAYSGVLSGITLAQNIDANSITLNVADRSVAVNWTPLDASPQHITSEGYRFEASTSPFDGGAPVYFASTTVAATASLSIPGLWPNTAYYLRAGSFNWKQRLNWFSLGQAATLPGKIPGSPYIGEIQFSSMTARWQPLATNGYVLEASTAPDFGTILYSSSTTDPGVAQLSIVTLERNTVYYFRAGALYNGATAYAVLGGSSTLSAPVGGQQIAAVNVTSITVTWNPLPPSPQNATSEGYVLVLSTAPDFSGTAISVSTRFSQTGSLTAAALSPNTPYYLKVGSLNWDGTASYVTVITTPAATTLASRPVSAGYTNVAQSGITLNWLANGNPGWTQYEAELSTDNFVTVAAFAVTPNTAVNFSGLVPNTTYYARVTAFNSSGLPAGPVFYSPVVTLAALPGVPSVPYLIGVSSLTANWISNNLPGTPFIAELSSSPVFSGLVLASATTLGSAVFPGLVANTTYYGRVSALNHSGVPTMSVPLGAALTYPAVPASSGTTTFGDVILDAFTVNWAVNGNSTMTVYQLVISTVPDFSLFVSSVSTLQTGWRVFNLTLGTTYYVEVNAVGAAGAQSDYCNLGAVLTLKTGQGGISATQAGSVVLPTSYGNIVVSVPAGGFGGSVRLQVETVASPPSAPCPTASLSPTGVAISVDVFPKLRPVKSLTISVPYKRSELEAAGFDLSKLILAGYDPAADVWTPLPSVSLQSENRVIGQAGHLSVFQIMQTAAAVTLDNVKIFPNPYKPSGYPGEPVKVTNLPAFADLKIYTFLGELVREFHADSNGIAVWDGMNEWNAKTASGVYAVLIRTADGADKKIMKLAVER